MPNSIISQDQSGRDLFNAISSFFSLFQIGKLLRKCNAQKEKGVQVLDIFRYKLCNVFSDRSMYMQQKTGSFRESFSKNTFYRFLNAGLYSFGCDLLYAFPCQNTHTGFGAGELLKYFC